VVDHNLDERLPPLGTFDVVVSSFAIHHVTDERKRQLFAEVRGLLEPGGMFCNLEHVASASAAAHRRFLDAIGTRPEDEDPSNKLLDLSTQLTWLRAIGFMEVDCVWKWRGLALMVDGVAPRKGTILAFIRRNVPSLALAATVLMGVSTTLTLGLTPVGLQQETTFSQAGGAALKEIPP
jgi:SAM-dependent methyltransferase